MNQRPIIDSQDYLPYILLNQNLQIQYFSQLLTECLKDFENIEIGHDIRSFLPELVGLEQICQEVLAQKQDKFVLESVAREKEKEQIIYFDISIQSIQNQLVLFFDDVTELIKLRQSFVQKANEAELTLNALKRFEYCTNKIIDSMEEVLFITDSVGKIERTNRAAVNLFGYPKTEIVNRPINFFLNKKEVNFPEIYQFLVENQNSVKKLETCVLDCHHNQIEIEFNCFIAPTEITDLFNCVYIGRDITLRKKAEREMMAALTREKELKELKSRFLSMASHEFRNPLSSILVCTEMLSNNNLPTKEQNLYLELIKESALNIQSILEDVLVLSKAEAGQKHFKPTRFDLIEFCQQIIQELQLSYTDRQINLITNRDHLEFYGDSKLLWHIFNNLLSNALKYSPASEDVEMTIESQESNIQITICDRGIGIPPEAQKHLFESFYRANNVGDTPGTGLGLAIVQRAINLHQGTINIVSNLNQGTTIYLQLPNSIGVDN